LQQQQVNLPCRPAAAAFANLKLQFCSRLNETAVSLKWAIYLLLNRQLPVAGKYVEGGTGIAGLPATILLELQLMP
jgi:hypothetical protein